MKVCSRINTHRPPLPPLSLSLFPSLSPIFKYTAATRGSYAAFSSDDVICGSVTALPNRPPRLSPIAPPSGTTSTAPDLKRRHGSANARRTRVAAAAPGDGGVKTGAVGRSSGIRAGVGAVASVTTSSVCALRGGGRRARGGDAAAQRGAIGRAAATVVSVRARAAT